MLNAIALGTFDGIHSGHRAVFNSIKDYRVIAVTFKTPPKAVLSGVSELLMTPEDKYQALYDYGADVVDMPDFSDIRDMSPEVFLKSIKEKYNPAAIACGFNYRFGYNAQGDTEYLRDFCQRNNIEFLCAAPVERDGRPVSSSLIREYIADGKIKEANSEIYGGFGFAAEVIHGDHRGRTIGFPTINQIYPVCLVKPKFGVYGVEVEIDGHNFKAITNLGYRPTYKTKIVTAETYIPHFLGDLYGRRLRIRLQKFIRPERCFSSLDELKNAIDSDVTKLFGN